MATMISNFNELIYLF